MRGKPLPVCRRAFCVGITPAYAGKTMGRDQREISARDHPRVCGENHRPCRSSSRRAGSPPRMRGKPLACLCHPLRLRITPAYAGKTRASVTSTSCHRDHPRVCGENQACRRGSASQRGSPPRMRGKRQARFVTALVTGITPAYAGKTRDYIGRDRKSRDHPRVCGENRRSR